MNYTARSLRTLRSFFCSLLLPLLPCAIGGCASQDSFNHRTGKFTSICIDKSAAKVGCEAFKDMSPAVQSAVSNILDDIYEEKKRKKERFALQPYEIAQFIEASDRFKKYEIPKEILDSPPLWLDNERLVFSSRQHTGWKAKELEPSRIMSYNVVTGELVDSGYRGQVRCLNHLGELLIYQADNEDLSNSKKNKRRWFTGTWGKPLQRTYYAQEPAIQTYRCNFDPLPDPTYRDTPGSLGKDSVRFTPLLPQHGVLKETEFSTDGTDNSKIFLLKPDGKSVLIANKQLNHYHFTYQPWSDTYFEVQVAPAEPRTFFPSGEVVSHPIPKLFQYWKQTIYSSIAAYPSRLGIIWSIQQKFGYWRKQGLYLQTDKELLRIEQGYPSAFHQFSPDGCKLTSQIHRGDPYGDDWRDHTIIVIDLCKEHAK